jgi:hypothetical protein
VLLHERAGEQEDSQDGSLLVIKGGVLHVVCDGVTGRRPRHGDVVVGVLQS